MIQYSNVKANGYFRDYWRNYKIQHEWEELLMITDHVINHKR